MSTTPKLPPGVRRLFRLPWSRSRVLRDVNDEVRFHLEMRIAALEARGMTRAQAATEALRRFGDVHELRESSMRVADRQARMRRVREELATSVQDIRLALRRLWGSPMFTMAATLTLALAIGATASVFSLVDGVLLKRLPYHDPDRVLTLWESSPERHLPQSSVATGTYLDWAAQSTSYGKVAAATTDQMRFTVIGAHDAERVLAQAVTPSFFDVLGITPILGRRVTRTRPRRLPRSC